MAEGDQENWEPVTNLTKQNFPLDTWQKWASPVWMDIRRTDVLNGHEGTAMGDESHSQISKPLHKSRRGCIYAIPRNRVRGLPIY